MGTQEIIENLDAANSRAFIIRLLRDLRALEAMIDQGAIESGVRRIGVEQELFLVDRSWRPAPLAMEILKAVEISKALKIPVISVWPGSDGADYHFQIDYRQSIEWFAEALIAVNRECLKAGIKLAMEPKPYEPRELYMIIPTAAAAILVAQHVNQATGGNNCGLTVDYGHQKMEATTASTACDLAAFAGVPIHKFDVNDARQGRNDQDLMFGTISVPEAVEYLFTTFVRDYRGWYSQDQFTYRDDPTRAMERSMVNFANLALKAVKVYARQDELTRARERGTGPDVLDVVSPILLG